MFFCISTAESSAASATLCCCLSCCPSQAGLILIFGIDSMSLKGPLLCLLLFNTGQGKIVLNVDL